MVHWRLRRLARPAVHLARRVTGRTPPQTGDKANDAHMSYRARSATEELAQSTLNNPEWPRLLILDASPMGGGSATGQLLASEFRGWPGSDLLQVSSSNGQQLRVHRHNSTSTQGAPADLADCLEQIQTFDPEVVFFRPDSRSVPLYELWKALDDGHIPLALNIVDDWLLLLSEGEDPSAQSRADEVAELAARAGLGWAISGSMAQDLNDRYGLNFDVISNTVDRGTWPTTTAPKEQPLVFNYAGWPANHKGGASLNQLALVANQFRSRQMRLNIKMPDNGDNAIYANAYRKLSNVKVGPWLFGNEYRQFLSDSGVNVLTFNFDDSTIGYLRHSFANRIPDLMMAGRPILVVGPRELLSVRYLASAGAIHVPELELEQIDAAVRHLLDDKQARDVMAAKIANESLRFDAAVIRPRFQTKLMAFARGQQISDAELITDPLRIDIVNTP